MEQTVLIEKLKENISRHMRPYNLGDMGETETLIMQLIALVESPSPAKAEKETPHVRKEDIEAEWDSLWKDIVTNPDGSINIEQVKKELYDFSYVMEQVPKVYCHVTGNRLSKIMYPAETVMAVADDYTSEITEREIKESQEEQEGLRWVDIKDSTPRDGVYSVKCTGWVSGVTMLGVGSIVGGEWVLVTFLNKTTFGKSEILACGKVEYLTESTPPVKEDFEKKYKEANQFIIDLAKEFGQEGLGYDDLSWTIEDFIEAARTKFEAPVKEAGQPRNLPIEELIKLSDDELNDEIDKIRSRLGMGKREQSQQQPAGESATKEREIAFAEWIREQNYKPYAGWWYSNGNNFANQPISEQGLYDLWQQSQNNKP